MSAARAREMPSHGEEPFLSTASSPESHGGPQTIEPFSAGTSGSMPRKINPMVTLTIEDIDLAVANESTSGSQSQSYEEASQGDLPGVKPDGIAAGVVADDAEEAELTGEEAPPEAPEDDGQRYQIISELGRGGYGTVYRALHEFLDRQVAIKYCTAESPTYLERFQAEARITASLEHPSIIPVYDAGHGYIVMKLISGQTLEDLILVDRDKPDYPRLIEVLISVCNAIEFAHNRNVIHRDLKAVNIMAGAYGEVILMDWGLATRLDEDGKVPKKKDGVGPSLCAGTPACLPPEVARAQRDLIGTSADVFCLGAILYHILTGLMPFCSYTVRHSLRLASTNYYQPVRVVNPDAPPRLAEIQKLAMSTDPSQRPTVGQLRELLRRWLLQSGNRDEAIVIMNDARELARQAGQYGKKDWELMYDAYIEAIAMYDKATTLAPDIPGLAEERQHVMQTYVKAALRIGDIALARLLSRNRSLPVNRPV